jgi:hypothetical protein
MARYTDAELLPCPFCDGEVEFHPQEHHMENFWNKNTIYCPTCDFMMEGVSRLQLFNRWNTRKPMEQIVERLEEEMNNAKNLWDDDEYYTGMANANEYAIDTVRNGGRSMVCID